MVSFIQLLAFNKDFMSLKKYRWSKQKYLVAIPTFVGAFFLALIYGGSGVKFFVTLIGVIVIFSISYNFFLKIWNDIYKGKKLLTYHIIVVLFQLVVWGVVFFNLTKWE